jgi:hypothetical protein
MAKKTKEPANGKPTVKYICTKQDMTVVLFEKDVDGKKVEHSNAHGNSRLPTVKEFHFSPVFAQKGKMGMYDAGTAYCFIICSLEFLGEYYDQMIEYLEKLRKNPINQLFLEEDWDKARNPEAFKANEKVSELEDALEKEKRRTKELEAQLGLSSAE